MAEIISAIGRMRSFDDERDARLGIGTVTVTKKPVARKEHNLSDDHPASEDDDILELVSELNEDECDDILELGSEFEGYGSFEDALASADLMHAPQTQAQQASHTSHEPKAQPTSARDEVAPEKNLTLMTSRKGQFADPRLTPRFEPQNPVQPKPKSRLAPLTRSVACGSLHRQSGEPMVGDSPKQDVPAHDATDRKLDAILTGLNKLTARIEALESLARELVPLPSRKKIGWDARSAFSPGRAKATHGGGPSS